MRFRQITPGAAPKEGAEPNAPGEPLAPNSGALVAPNAGVLAAPKAGAPAAPNAGVLLPKGEDAPNAGVAGAAPNAGADDAPKALLAPKAGCGHNRQHSRLCISKAAEACAVVEFAGPRSANPDRVGL